MTMPGNPQYHVSVSGLLHADLRGHTRRQPPPNAVFRLEERIPEVNWRPYME